MGTLQKLSYIECSAICMIYLPSLNLFNSTVISILITMFHVSGSCHSISHHICATQLIVSQKIHLSLLNMQVRRISELTDNYKNMSKLIINLQIENTNNVNQSLIRVNKRQVIIYMQTVTLTVYVYENKFLGLQNMFAIACHQLVCITIQTRENSPKFERSSYDFVKRRLIRTQNVIVYFDICIQELTYEMRDLGGYIVNLKSNLCKTNDNVEGKPVFIVFNKHQLMLVVTSACKCKQLADYTFLHAPCRIIPKF